VITGMLDRRTILRGALGAAATTALPSSFAAGNIDVTPVTRSLALCSGAGGNVLALTTAER